MQQTCQTCAYFIQHYAKYSTGYTKTAWGHCYRPRIKLRKADAPVCPRYRERPSNGGEQR